MRHLFYIYSPPQLQNIYDNFLNLIILSTICDLDRTVYSNKTRELIDEN